MTPDSVATLAVVVPATAFAIASAAKDGPRALALLRRGVASARGAMPGRRLPRRKPSTGCPDCSRWRSALEAAHAARLPEADRAPEHSVLAPWEREELAELAGMRAEASPGRVEWGQGLADILRERLPDMADADMARVVLRILRFAEDCGMQLRDAHEVAAVLEDSLAIAAADLGSAELCADARGLS